MEEVYQGFFDAMDVKVTHENTENGVPESWKGTFVSRLQAAQM